MCVWACYYEVSGTKVGTGTGETPPSMGMGMGGAVPNTGMGMGEAVANTGMGSKWYGGMLDRPFGEQVVVKFIVGWAG